MVAGRVGLAAGCFAAPDLILRGLGFPDHSSTARTFARMLGVRDLALALLLTATASDPAVHRRAVQVAGLVDLGDVASISLGAVRDPALRPAALRNLPFAGGSALFCFLAARSG
jgi:hypothetical protein